METNKRKFRVRVSNGLRDECEVTVSVAKRRTIAGFAILTARRVIPDVKPWRTEILREET